MRLRYLHLPRCGPLTDTAVVFGREDLIARTLNLPRKGSLNFVVGVNGSGKSSLLRAVYRAFRALKSRQAPSIPLTLAWDIAPSDETVTAFLHIPQHKDEKPYFVALKQIPVNATKVYWERLTESLKSDMGTIDVVQKPDREDPVRGSYLQAHLPKRLIAYSSGAIDPWAQLDHPAFHPKDEDEGQYETEEDRPPGWSMDLEWEEEQPIRISNVLTRYALKGSGTAQSLPGAGQVGELSSDTVERLRQELGPLEEIRRKVFSNRMPRTERMEESYFRIAPPHLRYAGITMALYQAAKELAGRTADHQRQALRNLFLRKLGRDGVAPDDGRRVLTEIDWFVPTHLSLTYRDADDRVSPRQHQELLCLVALADEVIAQPRGRMRAIISLGASDRISLTDKLKDAFRFGIPSKTIEFIAERVDGCKTGAEAVLRIFSEDKDIDSTPMDVFTRLRDWERTGLLEDLSLTLLRNQRPQASDGTPDDVVVTYDQLSDGEQMLLGRMGLLFLLRGQDGSLLLLDEPETHFNDVWKREIVEMVDLGLLNSTQANVVVATHTSIALTDAFAAEVTVLDKTDGQTVARGVTGGLFGTDPGEVTMNLFRADSSIGSRSVDLLEKLLKADWKGREQELESVLAVLGSSFHRAELRAILKQLQKTPNGTASS